MLDIGNAVFVVVDHGWRERDKAHTADFFGILVDAGGDGRVVNTGGGQRNVFRNADSEFFQSRRQGGKISQDGIGLFLLDPFGKLFLLLSGVDGVDFEQGQPLLAGQVVLRPVKAGSEHA